VRRTFFLCLLALLPVPFFSAFPADEFSWRQCQGQVIRVLLDDHPYAVGIKRRLGDFETLTGIKVVYMIQPEGRYFSTLDKALASGVGNPDVYMTGPYQVWEYAPTGRMMALDAFLYDPSKTRATYNMGDFFPAVAGAFRWNGRAGTAVGDGPLWALPVGFEFAALIYNREVLSNFRLAPPQTMTQLIETGRHLNHFEGDDTYGVAARGLGAWNSLHSGYITAFVNHGAKDMTVENGRLVSTVNSPEAVAITDQWVTMLKECGAPDWEFFDWYRCLDDIGERKTALLYDSCTLGYHANALSSQSGKLGVVYPPAPSDSPESEIKSNLWAWGLAINPASSNPDASWLFIQYFTSREFQLWSVLEWNSMNPPRRSVFEDSRVQMAIASMEGYAETLSGLVQNASVFFTPNPYFHDISERWAAVIRDIANGMYGSTQEGMDTLKVWMDNKLLDVPVE